MSRSGEILIDDADRVEALVGTASGLDSHTVGDLLPILEKISTQFLREAISVCGMDIFIRVPLSMLREAKVKLAILGIPLHEVTIHVID